jgi:hypothetical protein
LLEREKELNGSCENLLQLLSFAYLPARECCSKPLVSGSDRFSCRSNGCPRSG